MTVRFVRIVMNGGEITLRCACQWRETETCAQCTNGMDGVLKCPCACHSPMHEQTLRDFQANPGEKP